MYVKAYLWLFFLYSWVFFPQWNRRQKVIFKPRKGYLSLSLSFSLFFKWDQPAISEQCKWVLPIHSSVICHKSQGLGEDFEMLIQLRMVTSLRTFKKKKKIQLIWSFMCAWKLWRLPLSLSLPPSPIVRDVKAKYEIPSCPDCIKSRGIFFFFSKSIRSERRLKKKQKNSHRKVYGAESFPVWKSSKQNPVIAENLSQVKLGNHDQSLCPHETLPLLCVSKPIISFI